MILVGSCHHSFLHVSFACWLLTTKGTPAISDDSAAPPSPAKKSRAWPLCTLHIKAAPSQRHTAHSHSSNSSRIPLQNEELAVRRWCVSQQTVQCPLLKPKPLFKNVFCVSPSSAPVKRMFSQRFSQSWLIMCANRARMSDFMLESLVFLSCNSHLWLPGICLKLSQCNFQCSRFVTVQDYRLLLF